MKSYIFAFKHQAKLGFRVICKQWKTLMILVNYKNLSFLNFCIERPENLRYYISELKTFMCLWHLLYTFSLLWTCYLCTKMKLWSTWENCLLLIKNEIIKIKLRSLKQPCRLRGRFKELTYLSSTFHTVSVINPKEWLINPSLHFQYLKQICVMVILFNNWIYFRTNGFESMLINFNIII